jgi:uncharacterized protein DUF3108
MQRIALIPLLLLLFISAMDAQTAARPPVPAKPAPSHTTTTSAPVSQDTIGPQSYIRPTPDSYRFPNGQTLHYTAEWRLWNAGIATVKMEAAGSEQKISATADSIGFVSLLYKVADRFEAYFDRKSFCSTHIYKHSEEGLHKRDTNIRFDQLRRKAILDEKNLKNNETKHTEQDIPGCVTDVISAIFYVGSLPLEIGQAYTFPLNDGGKTVDVKAYVRAREDIKTDAGTFHTIRVEPEAESGVLKGKGKAWIWYTDDANHTPVQMRTRMFWGMLTFKLTRIDRAQ